MPKVQNAEQQNVKQNKMPNDKISNDKKCRTDGRNVEWDKTSKRHNVESNKGRMGHNVEWDKMSNRNKCQIEIISNGTKC